MTWLDPKWTIVALIPGAAMLDTGKMTLAAPATLRNVDAVYARRYVELLKCCDGCDSVYYRWGEPVAAAAIVAGSGKQNDAFPVVAISGSYSFKNVVDIFNLEISATWAEGSNPTWNGAPQEPPPGTPITWRPLTEMLPTTPPSTYKAVSNINCDSPPYTAPPNPLPSLPTVASFAKGIIRPGTLTLP